MLDRILFMPSTATELLIEATPLATSAVLIVIIVNLFFNFHGNLENRPCLAATFAILTLLVFGLQLLLTSWVTSQREIFLNDMHDMVTTIWIDINHTRDYLKWDEMELDFKCCGDHNFTDYVLIGEAVPGTCCGYLNRSWSCSADIYANIEGCNFKVVDYWTNITNIFRLITVGRCLIEFIIALLIVTFLAVLMCKTKKFNRLRLK